MTTEEGLLCDILDKPADDLPRLVYADWLEENGKTERADTIRLMLNCRKTKSGQIDSRTKGARLMRRLLLDSHPGFETVGFGPAEWKLSDGVVVFGSEPWARLYYRRGFIEYVRCPLASWTGTKLKCECGPTHQCRRCRWSLWEGGIGPKVVSGHPAARVLVADKSPRQMDPRMGSWVWWQATDGDTHPASLPEDIYQLVYPSGVRWFRTEEEAQKRLSFAMYVWAKSQPA